VLSIKYKIKTQKIPYCPNTYNNPKCTVFNCLTVYSKIHSATANCVTGVIHTYIFTIQGIEMRGTNKYKNTNNMNTTCIILIQLYSGTVTPPRTKVTPVDFSNRSPSFFLLQHTFWFLSLKFIYFELTCWRLFLKRKERFGPINPA
jgi:hypothetical protein